MQFISQTLKYPLRKTIIIAVVAMVLSFVTFAGSVYLQRVLLHGCGNPLRGVCDGPVYIIAAELLLKDLSVIARIVFEGVTVLVVAQLLARLFRKF